VIGESASTFQKVGLLLVLALLVYLLLQTGTAPVLSSWNGGVPGNAIGATVGSGVSPKAVTLGGMAQAQTGRGGAGTPSGNPLGGASVVLTQGYGVGSHAPAEVWGGVDLALDGNGDGHADPGATAGAPIYATIAGTAHVKPDTWPAGNYLSITNDQYKVAFAHLSRYAVEDGQQVEVGQVIGYVGSTGQSSGPHLHYEVWKDGSNVDPLDFGALDGAK
jgi:murein DD-endopeptidase MepM/ murein hydrolase activator NlpD